MEGSAQESKSGAGEDGETKKKEAKKDEKKQKKSKKAKKKKNKEIRKVSIGRAYIKASYNNTMITLTDNNGNVLITGSAGQLGFKGPKKSTPYASSIIVRDIINKVKSYGLQTVSVFVNGVGAGRESAVRALNANGLNILSIKDITPVPHNGCRAKKPRRV
ncbi:MAG: 30S ribosomal protein S11 [bacterium]